MKNLMFRPLVLGLVVTLAVGSSFAAEAEKTEGKTDKDQPQQVTISTPDTKGKSVRKVEFIPLTKCGGVSPPSQKNRVPGEICG